MESTLDSIRHHIMADEQNRSYTHRGIEPLYTASPDSKIVIIGQAPGNRAEQSGLPWNDASGQTLRSWLNVDTTNFYNPDLIALIPMDFYFPGRGKHGDLPPRPGVAQKWHPQLLALMPQVKLTLLIGQYAQKYYLGHHRKSNLTRTVQAYQEYLPKYFPLVHPSPLNFRWQAKNPWFSQKVIPDLQQRVSAILHPPSRH